jgi:hypothetical protein
MSDPTRDPEPGPALLVRGVPPVVVATHDFRAGVQGGGPLVPAGTRFRLQAPDIFAAGYAEEGGELVLMAKAAAGHLFVGDLIAAPAIAAPSACAVGSVAA